MKITVTFFITLAVFIGVNGDDSIDWSAHQWQAPTATDSRGPCPGLNTLANHGFLPRNGSNITTPVVLNAINDGFNFRPINILRTAAKLGLLTTDAEDSFSLSDLALHGTLEHDASLSRNDYALGDNIHFNETVFTTLANSNPGVDYYNTTSAAQVLEQRLAEDKIVNPDLINTLKDFFVRAIESAFYLSVMGNVTTGVAPKNFVQILFREERLPLEEGWKPSETPIDDDTLDGVLEAIEDATNWAPSGEVICPWIRLQPEGDVTIVQG
ncbi:MAG: Cloroperoxidase [Lentinula lateritia]|uniref:Cloroperoxidase n=2 Tax=Lentinula TaxID=5352 RepID=A0ACC1TVF2_9AGAR|nr:Cloroperoxidase [Lentinula aff. lateritia]KAJ3851337.1 Cloroperoxidase [Lentinula lateritia]KAJ3930114.1 MAG: Cloroperoxidase [Lentinula lateritia]KAJ4475837.1 Peroxidase, family 2-domain-containing protein [Lentinula lateritia]